MEQVPPIFHLQALSTINVKLYDIGHMPMISKHGIAIVLSCAAVTWWCGTHIKRAARHLVGTPMRQQMIQGVWSCIPGLPCDFLGAKRGRDWIDGSWKPLKIYTVIPVIPVIPLYINQGHQGSCRSCCTTLCFPGFSAEIYIPQ